MVANRNGFFYVLDRTNGEFLLAKPFVKQTWAKEIGKDGRPVELPDQRPTPKGTLTCPDLFGGTNFMSPSYDPAARLFFVSARETCMVYVSQPPTAATRRATARWAVVSGRVPSGATARCARSMPRPASVKWELRHDSPSWAGVLSTAGGVVFTGTNEGDLVAADSRTGKELWRYQLGHPLYAGPTTFMLDSRQYVVAGAGTTLTAFALPR